MSPEEADGEFWEAELARFLPDAQKALREGLEYVCCPICYVVADVPFDYFSVLPKRWAEEPSLREVVCRAGGFCHHHTWRLDRVQGLFPIATIYLEVLRSWMEGAAERDPCPVCRLQRLMEGVLLEAFAQWMREEEARSEYPELFGLCYPHYHRVLGCELDEATRQAVTEAQAAQSERLIQLLHGYIEKNEIPVKWDRTDAELRAPKRALLKTAGEDL